MFGLLKKFFGKKAEETKAECPYKVEQPIAETAPVVEATELAVDQPKKKAPAKKPAGKKPAAPKSGAPKRGRKPKAQ